MEHDPALIRIISDCMCRSDGLDPDAKGMLVYDEGGRRVSSRDWYDRCAQIMIDTLERHGFHIKAAG